MVRLRTAPESLAHAGDAAPSCAQGTVRSASGPRAGRSDSNGAPVSSVGVREGGGGFDVTPEALDGAPQVESYQARFAGGRLAGGRNFGMSDGAVWRVAGMHFEPIGDGPRGATTPPGP